MRSFCLLQAPIGPEGQRSPPAAEPQDSYPFEILIKHTGNEMEEEVAFPGGCHGNQLTQNTICLGDTYFFKPGFHRQN